MATPAEDIWGVNPALVSITGRDMGRRRPYYIAAPRFDSKSAGIKSLYLLCHLLNMKGEEAYILLETPGTPSGAPADMFCPTLTQDVTKAHYANGREPVQVLSESSVLGATQGVIVRYVLNYLGVVGPGGELPTPTDLVVAYSRRLADRLPQTDMVLFLPVSDISFWRLPPKSEPRSGFCAYLGKRRAVDGLGLPAEVEVDVILTRESARELIRQELWRREAIVVFENTALIGEALLCGCPVICAFNDKFPDLLAEVELGSDGVVTWPCTSDQLSAARESASLYSARYRQRIELVDKDIIEFVALTQQAASRRPLESPVIPPRLALAEVISRTGEKFASLATGLNELGFVEFCLRLTKMRSYFTGSKSKNQN